MKAIKPTAYARFLNALDSLDRMKPGGQLDSLEQQILDYVYRASVNQKQLLVGDVIHLEQFGSQATLLARLKNLVGKGYIELLENRIDGRRKSLQITKKAELYYRYLSECMNKALKP